MLQPPIPSSQRRRELVNLVLVVLFMGLVSNILASYLSIEVFKMNIFGVSVAIWFAIVLCVLTVVATYFLILTPKVKQVAIYTNLMVKRDPRLPGALGAECIYSSDFAPLAIQRGELLWKALVKDVWSLADSLLENLHKSESDALSLDLIEYLVFEIVLSGFEAEWASGTIKSYGYPTFPIRGLGEVIRIQPSTIYSIEEKPAPKILAMLTGHTQFEYKSLRPVVEGNQLVEHFLGNTSLNYIHTPGNWWLFTPKGTQISVKREGRERIIKLSNCYATITLNIKKEGVGSGLPYGVRIKEKEYNSRSFFTTDFRIDFKAHFSRWLLLHPKIDDYDNWTQLVFKKLVANFSLSRKGVIEEIE
jgi:hypothetical protein